MSRSLWWRFFGISVFFALVLSAFYLFMIKQLSERPGDEVQRSIYLFITRMVEENGYSEGLARVQSYRTESPAMPLQLWIVDSSNHVLASSADSAPPAALLRRDKPVHIHEVAARGHFFSGGSASAVVRLQASAPRYLLIRNPGTTGRGAVMTMIVLFIATVVGAILLGLLLLTLYLRGRSSEASKVIRDMQAGNLAARFSTDKLDAIGGLMLHFNAMANEIQRLVGRLQTIERTRRELLQELGHDLRTPLTSLRTAIDTLTVHGSAMDEAERKELFTVVSSELEYFTKLIDDLFFIASIDEPSYHAQAGEFDLLALLRTETSHAQTSQTATGKQLRFELDDSANSGFNGHISGDAYLIARLFRNVYDNAARHASTRVRTRILPHGDALEIVIDDDGQGLSPEALHRFGLRRDQRILASGSHAAVSLGLGSVIIKTIIELHGGSLKITNGDADSDFPGMRLHLYFPALVK